MVKEVICWAKEFIEHKAYQKALDMYKNTWMFDGVTQEDVPLFEGLAEAHKGLEHELYSKAYMFQAKMLGGEGEKFIQATVEKQRELEKELMQNKENYKVFYDLAYQHIAQLQMIEACIYYKVYRKFISLEEGETDEVYEIIEDYEYAKRFYKQLENKNHTYCVIVQENEREEKQVMMEALTCLGQKVYCITQYIEDYNSELKEVLVNFAQKECKEESWILIGDREKLKTISEDMRINKIIQKIYTEDVVRDWPCLSAYFIGNYLYTAKYLYGFDVIGEMNKIPEVDVSIVIPVKKYSYTLEKTLETCLNQRYDNYEIVVSDNSESDEIYKLITQLNHPKIKYYKTPYTLPLVKSFEYGYLRARGEFIFSIGADDGLMPYTIEMIVRIMKQFPEENIISWSRLLYIWPDLVGNGTQDRFSFPQKVEKNKVQVVYWSTHEIMLNLIEKFNQRISNIYALPMLYINSGMRRAHILKVIEKTGKFLDGHSQDVYTGILNMALYDKILHVNYPLSIAGMSKSSIGAASVFVNHGLEKYKQSILGHNDTIAFVEIPSTPSQRWVYPQFDYALFIYEILKVCDLEVNDKCNLWKESIDFKKLFEWLAVDNVNRGSEGIDFITCIKKCAYAYDNNIGKWWENIEKMYHLPKDIELKKEETPKKTPKNYQTGNIEESLIIDSAKFGIKDIKGACDFFINLYNL